MKTILAEIAIRALLALINKLNTPTERPQYTGPHLFKSTGICALCGESRGGAAQCKGHK
jgi:hypothetical protein